MEGKITENKHDQEENDRINELNMLAWLMLTPLNKLPAMPQQVSNEDNTELGNKILDLIESEKISVRNMDINGVLNFDHVK